MNWKNKKQSSDQSFDLNDWRQCYQQCESLNILDQQTLFMFRILQERPNDTVSLRLIHERIESATTQQVIDPLANLAPINPEQIIGEIPIGKTSKGHIYGLDLNQFILSVLTIGSSGSGKSNVLKLKLLSLLLRVDVQVLIFAAKRNFRELIVRHPNIVVIPWRFLRINLLRNPRGVALDLWNNTIIPALTEIDLRFASTYFIVDMCKWLYSEFGYTGLHGQSCPNLLNLRDAIADKKIPLSSNQARYRESSLNRLTGILNHTGSVFDCNHGIDISKTRGIHVVIETDGLPDEIRDIIIKDLLLREYHSRLANRTLCATKFIVMVDEGQSLFRGAS